MVDGTDEMPSVFTNCLMHGTQAQELSPTEQTRIIFAPHHETREMSRACCFGGKFELRTVVRNGIAPRIGCLLDQPSRVRGRQSRSVRFSIAPDPSVKLQRNRALRMHVGAEDAGP
eukprot:365783-Chlamydomonas_euryale.AAC.10